MAIKSEHVVQFLLINHFGSEDERSWEVRGPPMREYPIRTMLEDTKGYGCIS